jgi:peptidoglycan hydrolase-like protein with peptidoglycan-binding domain
MTLSWVSFTVAALLVVPLGACAQLTARPQPAVSTLGSERPALDRLLTSGDIQVAEGHLKAFGFDPGPVDGLFTTQTQAAVRAFQARYSLPVSGLLDYATRQELLPGLDFQKPGQ